MGPHLVGMLQWSLNYQMSTWTRWIHICKPEIYYWMLLIQGPSKTSNFKGTPNFMIPSLSCSYWLSLDLSLPRDSMSHQIVFQNFLPLSYPDSVWDVWNQEFWLVQDEYVSSWPDIKSTDLTPKANVISNGKTPETFSWMPAIRQGDLCDHLPY